MNFRKRIVIWVRVIYSYLVTISGVKSEILSATDTVQSVKRGKTLIRFGDGELGIYNGKDIHYQRWSKELLEDFQSIKKNYEIEKEACPYILAMPKHFMQCNGIVLAKKRVYVSSWSEARFYFEKNFRREDIVYGDSFLFEKKNKNVYSELWSEGSPKNVIFVHNNVDYACRFAGAYGKRVYFIEVPPRDAYEAVDELQNNILGVVNENRLSYEAFQVVISAGPAGKVLAYRLSKLGIHCIDAGHCWDDPLES